jgi:hypothetical protein
MKTLTTLFALALFCATGYGQTIKSLGFNTTNGEVVANTGTNVLTFTNAFTVATNAVAQVRTNLNLGAPWLTNTNAELLRVAIGLTDTNIATVFSALWLWDETNDEAAFRIDEAMVIVSEALITTNAPTDTTNAVRWIEVQGGTNNYFIPLFQ